MLSARDITTIALALRGTFPDASEARDILARLHAISAQMKDRQAAAERAARIAATLAKQQAIDEEVD